jgi:ribose 5-phosphate isomerase
MRPADEGKRTAAEAAVALVENGLELGLGIGSTMRYAPDALGRRVGEGPRVNGMSISKQTARRRAAWASRSAIASRSRCWIWRSMAS